MTDELKQLALRTVAEFDQRGQYNAVLNAFREVQRQTVEAAERAMDSELTQDETHGEVMVFANGLLRRFKARIRRSLLSPSQEVRNG